MFARFDWKKNRLPQNYAIYCIGKQIKEILCIKQFVIFKIKNDQKLLQYLTEKKKIAQLKKCNFIE